MSSHALLLRLFLSKNFFSVHVALNYLRLYSDNIGITYYLTRRLREVEISELREVWGFICHLLITRPSKSRALECFVTETAQRSTHIAMITLWFFQAALRDTAVLRHGSQSFMICQRTLQKCHEIIFGDLPPPISTPYGTVNHSFHARFKQLKMKAHVDPAVVGMALILAGAPGMPRLVEVMGQVAIEQGRTDDADQGGYRSLEVQEDQIARPPSTRASIDEEEEASPTSSVEGATDADAQNTTEPFVLDVVDASRKHKTHMSLDGTSTRRRLSASQTAPALHLQIRGLRRPQIEDPLGQRDAELPSRPETPYLSSPSISSLKTPLRSSSLNAAERLLQKYDSDAQSYLLRSTYCRSEVQFILALENISNKLLVIPKPARVSALRAELTALNHKLPAEVCMPMWCSSSDTPRSEGFSEPHHRIVRIPPGESVVLNSAERAPYLLLIEIINGDLDFDPNRRSNKELLKRIVTKEEQKRASKSGGDTPMFSGPSISRHKSQLGSVSNPDGAVDEPPDPAIALEPPTPRQIARSPTDEEEMDLVEQLYGEDHSLRSQPIDLSDSITLPTRPKNKELEMAAWRSSTPSTPQVGNFVPTFPPPSPLLGGTPPGISKPGQSPISAADNSRMLSLDEYSERMRTAAIMLAQLNASLVPEPIASVSVPTLPAGTPDVLSPPGTAWLPNASWLSSTPDLPKPGGPVHPSLAGGLPQPPSSSAPGNPSPAQPPASRMRLQHSEAAAIRERIMKEMLALEEERMERMREGETFRPVRLVGDMSRSAEDEGIIRRELNKADPSAVVFSESWAAKKSRIRSGSPYGHLVNWDCVSVIVKTGGDLRQEQLAVQLIQEFEHIWREENCQCWVRYFRILITGGTSGLIETLTDAVSIHSIKKAEYARRLAQGRLGLVTLMDHFVSTYGDPSSAKFGRAQRNFAKSLAGYSIICFLLQIKDRHNGNILLDRDGHLIHIDFGFILSNSPGNIGFEAAPFKLPTEYVEVLGGADGDAFKEFRRIFREGFELARKHCDRIVTLVELMQKDSSMPCFAAFGDQTASQLRDRFQPTLTHSLVGDYVDRLIDSSLGSNWTRLYDSFQYYSQSIL